MDGPHDIQCTCMHFDQILSDGYLVMVHQIYNPNEQDLIPAVNFVEDLWA